MDERVRFKDRLVYWIDNTFSKGVAALIAWLAVVSLVIIGLGAVLIAAFGFHQTDQARGLSFFEAAWEALMRTLDAGTMGNDTGWGYRIVMLVVTIGGVFVISSLIGILSNGLEDRVEHLRKGRSRVIEKHHTVIFGWSEQIFTILNELVQANANQKNHCIVILSNVGKVEMEDSIREKVPQKGVQNRTRIVCRTGSSIDTADLALTSLNASKSIIVLSSQESEDQDAEVIKTILAILNSPTRRSAPFHIVAELRDPRNFPIARVVGRNEVEWILVGDLVARIIAQTCRQSGLSAVYNELLDFEGVEIYFSAQPSLVGLTFGQALARFETNTVLGLFPHDGITGQNVEQAGLLNPPMERLINSGDRLILLAEDEDKISLSGSQPDLVQLEYITMGEKRPAEPERTLILGWNWRGPTVLRELDHYVAPGSTVQVVASLPDFKERVSAEVPALSNQTISVRQADTADRSVLESLEFGEKGHSRFDHVIVLSYLEDLTAQQADARTLITLLHLRDMADANDWHFSITSEILDVRNRELADVTRADDFIVSDRLVSLMLAQVSENKDLNAVFADLFDPAGSEVYLKPVEHYVAVGVPVNFYTVVESARRQSEVAIGYSIAALSHDARQAYGVTLSPLKSREVTFQPGDRIVLLAES